MPPCVIAARVWRDPRFMSVLGTGYALPGLPVSSESLLQRLQDAFGVRLGTRGVALMRRLGIRSRHLCRALRVPCESPQTGMSNPELAARAARDALADAGLAVDDVAYVIAHTATPARPLPANVADTAALLGFRGPHVELRQACTGFANALAMAQGLVSGPCAGPVLIIGSETGSVFCDPRRVSEADEQLVNFAQMGDAAAAIVVGPDSASGSRLGNTFYGALGNGSAAGFSLQSGGSDRPYARGVLEFTHCFERIRDHGLTLFDAAAEAAQQLGVPTSEVDWLLPHQANGRIAQVLAPRLGVETENIYVNADRVGNTGSAAIWLALAMLRKTLRPAARVLALGAEATQFSYGGFLYLHA